MQVCQIIPIWIKYATELKHVHNYILYFMPILSRNKLLNIMFYNLLDSGAIVLYNYWRYLFSVHTTGKKLISSIYFLYSDILQISL